MNRPTTLALALAVLICRFPGAAAAQHDMSRMGPASSAALPLGVPMSRTASGTSWLPDSAPQRMVHRQIGGWTLMAHGAGSLMYDRQLTLHGDSRGGLIDWEMISAVRALGSGDLRTTVMTSLESFFLPDTGYPLLLQTGESFAGRRIANMQHPHDLIGELSAAYERSLTTTLAASVYAAAVGEPALGPVSYMHRASARVDPFAPLGHHWQDAAHGSAGVVTAAVYTHSVRLEGSAFNGRDGDANRRDIDLGHALDSWAGRATFAPNGRIAMSAWAGYLADHDPLDPGVGMQRYGASLLGESRGLRGGGLSTAIIWGMNNHHHGARSHDHESTQPMIHHLSSSVLAEATLGVGTRSELLVRAEQVQKTADDLGFRGGNLMESFNVRTVTLAAQREVASRGVVALALGGRWSANQLPETLHYTYTTTAPTGFAVFAKLLPARAVSR